MKKLVSTSIIMVLVSCFIFAVPVVNTEVKNTASGATGSTVKVGVTGVTVSDVSYDIGFSKISIPQWSVKPVHFPNGYLELDPYFDENGQAIGSSNPNSLFLYWRIVSNKDVQLFIGLNGCMRNADSELGWSVSWTPFGQENKVEVAETVLEAGQSLPAVSETIQYESVTYKLIKDLPALVDTAASNAGSLELRVETAPIVGKISTSGTSYTGDICLKISVKE